MPKTRILVLISGNGSNLQAVIDGTTDGRISDAEVVQVISSKKDAYGLTRADNANIPRSHLSLLQCRKRHPELDKDASREKFNEELASEVLKYKPDIVVCAGWMLILSPKFLSLLKHAGVPIINLHPAAHGAFNGANAIERAYEAFQQGNITKTGIMIHYVIEEVDMGDPIIEKEVEILPGESLEDLTTRMHALEWVAIVEGTAEAIKKLSNKAQ